MILGSFWRGILSVIRVVSCTFASHLNYTSIQQYRIHVIGTMIITTWHLLYTVDKCKVVNDASKCIATFAGYSYSCAKIMCCLVVVSECPGGQWGLNCGNNCQCEHHECDHVIGCTSCSGHPGWTGANCDEDIDECLSPSYCSEHSDCENINGSAICHCHSWYNMVNGQCERKYWNTSI